MSTYELPLQPTTPSIASLETGEATFPSYFPADTVVSRNAENAPASRYGDASWDFRSMSTDGTQARTLHFHPVVGAADAWTGI